MDSTPQYLLDTHILLWWLSAPDKLNKKARDVISNRNNVLYVSSISFWEMAIKQGLGRLNLPASLLESLAHENILTLDLTPEDGLAVADLPAIHNDPFDRMLVVQAKRHDLILMTRDKIIKRYPVDVLIA